MSNLDVLFKLNISNFRGIKSSVNYTFQNNGIILIDGNSGSGKSTILWSIYFALYGKGANTPDKTVCELQWNNIRIKRTRKPNNLKVYMNDEMYEDLVGQEIIDNKFGIHSDFFLSSYICQKNTNSFMKLSALEKFQFMERINSYLDIDINLLKDKVKDDISFKKRSVNEYVNKLSVNKQLFESEEKDRLEKLDLLKTTRNYCLVKKIKSTECNQCISSFQDKINTWKKEVKECNDNIFKLQDTYLKSLNDAKKLEKYKKIEEKIKEYEEKVSEIDIVKLKQQKTFIETKKYYDDLLNIELSQFENVLIELDNKYTEKDLLNQRSLLDSLTSYKSSLNDITIMKTLEELSLELVNTERDYQESKGSFYTCPHCNEKIRVVNNKLEKITSIPDMKIDYQKKIKSIKHDIELIKKKKYIQKNIENIESKLTFDNTEDIDTLLDNIKNTRKYNDLISSTFTYFPTLKKLKETLNKSLIEVEDPLEVINEIILKYNIIQKELVPLRNDLRLNIVKDNIKIIHEDDFKKQQKNMKIIIEKNNENVELHTKHISDIRKYLEYITLKKKTIAKTKCINDLQDNFNILSSEINQLSIFLEIIEKTESQSLLLAIENINIVFQEWLEAFFPSLQIYGEIDTVKEFKNGNIKPQVSLKFQYNDRDVSDMSTFSGGEYDRIQLALTLTFAEIFSSPILMLDESISSLDSDTMETVLKSIKTKIRNKLVLIVAHQTITGGIFDDILHL